jgi:hypothetical protein
MSFDPGLGAAEDFDEFAAANLAARLSRAFIIMYRGTVSVGSFSVVSDVAWGRGGTGGVLDRCIEGFV